jgi:glycosyltransferase A (GT-A) superfamily protein (DUF2064 family)
MNKTAIILFANLPEFEARAKSFSAYSSQKATQQISQVLTQHFYQLAQQSSADSFLVDTYHQKGKSFGERITNAFIDIYAKGYENIICIGNDCPELNSNQLQNAINLVEQGNVVLGPTLDGGAYLMGIPKNKFNCSTFLNVKWQSIKTYQNLKQVFNNFVTELSLQVDIDSVEDLKTNYANNSLINVLRHLILSFKNKLSDLLNLTLIDFIKVDRYSLKAPPLA